jgi:hypothetical protein
MKNIEWTKCSLYIPIFKLHDVNTNHTLANNKEKHINYGNQYNTSETKENYRRIDIQSTQCANILLGPDSLLESYHFSTQNPILKVVLGFNFSYQLQLHVLSI